MEANVSKKTGVLARTMRPEAVIQRNIVKFLRTIGGAVWVTSQGYRKEPGGTRMTPGLPDLVVMFPAGMDTTQRDYPGSSTVTTYGVRRWTFVEVKAPKGKLSAAQILFRDESIKAGVPWELWRSVGDAVEWARAKGIVVEPVA